jgi:adenylyltransferase/sulfurtransferase
MRVQELAQRLEAKKPVFLIDVREPWEHEIAALPGSKLIPLSQLQARVDEITPPPDAAVVVYCHHGIRSLSAAALLEHLGVTPAYSLAGGIDAWSVAIDPKMPRY